MKGVILLNHTENTQLIEDEEQQRFVRSLLEQMGIPISEFWASEAPLTVEQKIRLKDVLNTFKIQIIDDRDGRVQVYFTDDNGEQELVGTFEKPTYKLKRDLAQRDPRKQLYLEMTVDCWSLFEPQENITE